VNLVEAQLTDDASFDATGSLDRLNSRARPAVLACPLDPAGGLRDRDNGAAADRRGRDVVEDLGSRRARDLSDRRAALRSAGPRGGTLELQADERLLDDTPRIQCPYHAASAFSPAADSAELVLGAVPFFAYEDRHALRG